MHKLSKHFIVVFRKIYANRGYREALPRMTDLRCHLLVDHLINWELLAIYAPDRMRLDMFDLLCTRGGGVFNVLFLQFSGQLDYKGIYNCGYVDVNTSEPYN